MSKSLKSFLWRKISIAHVRRILGDSLYNAISSYLEEYGSEKNIAPEDLLIDGLGSNILYNKDFQKVIIKEVFGPAQIESLCKELSIKFENSFDTRDRILTKSIKNIGLGIIETLDLDPNLYEFEEKAIHQNSEDVLIEPDPSRYLSLHDYQKSIKDETVYYLLDPEKSNRRMLIHMPTGSGKTKTSVEAIVDFIRTKIPQEGFVVWFAHSNELCSQAYDSLKETWKLKGDYPLPIYKIFGDQAYDYSIFDYDRAVLFIGFPKFNSLLNSNNKELIKLRSYIASRTKLAIIDEAHKTLARTYLKAIDYVSSNVNCRIIGLTATPGRSNDVNNRDNQILADYFDNTIINIKDESGMRLDQPLEYLQNQKVLAKIDHRPIEVNIENLEPYEIERIIRNKELDKSDIKRLVESPHRNRIIIDEIEKALNNPERDLILVFACSTEHCIIVKKLLEMRGIESEIVLGTTPKRDREKYIRDFKSGKLKVLINFGVLTTGFDAPKLKTLIIARHTNSIILYSQMIGRALRGPRNGGNERNYVVDLIDNISNLGNTDFMFSYWEDFWDKKFKT